MVAVVVMVVMVTVVTVVVVVVLTTHFHTWLWEGLNTVPSIPTPASHDMPHLSRIPKVLKQQNLRLTPCEYMA